MKINKNSWHYKLVRKSATVPPQNLCSYFRHLVLSIIMHGLYHASIGLVVFLFGGGLLYDIYLLISSMSPPKNGLVHVLYVYGLVSSAGLLTILLVFLSNILYELYKDHLLLKRRKDPLPSNPSIFKEMWRAKKEKMCPIIEYTDDNKKKDDE